MSTCEVSSGALWYIPGRIWTHAMPNSIECTNHYITTWWQTRIRVFLIDICWNLYLYVDQNYELESFFFFLMTPERLFLFESQLIIVTVNCVMEPNLWVATNTKQQNTVKTWDLTSPPVKGFTWNKRLVITMTLQEDLLETVQQCTTRWISIVRHLPYSEHLVYLSMDALKLQQWTWCIKSSTIFPIITLGTFFWIPLCLPAMDMLLKSKPAQHP